MNIPPSLREPRPGRRDRPLEIYAMQAGPAGLEVPVRWPGAAPGWRPSCRRILRRRPVCC